MGDHRELVEQLAAFLAPHVATPEECRSALKQTGDRLDAAAMLLLGGLPCQADQPTAARPATTKRERKRSAVHSSTQRTGLHSWLGVKRPRSASPDDDQADDSRSDQRPLLLQSEADRSAKPDRTRLPSSPKKSYIDVLRGQPTASTNTKSGPRPPIVLTTPQDIAKQLPTISLEQSPLDDTFATRLYLALLEEASQWKTYKWYMNDRLVESSHTSCFYRLDPSGGAQYYYAGRPEPEAPTFPPLLREALDFVNPLVNKVLSERKVRYDLEYDGPWCANVAAVNHYEGGASSVGYHADQLTYLGPCTTIASLSLGVQRNFRLRSVADQNDTAGARTYEIPLAHNSLLIMHAKTQEHYKHCVMPVGKSKAIDLFKPRWDVHGKAIPTEARQSLTSRINITFRFYRPDFAPLPGLRPTDGKARSGTPLCRCGVSTLLRADQKGRTTGRSAREVTQPTPPLASGTSTTTTTKPSDQRIIPPSINYFYQCQASALGTTGCNYFKLLGMEAEGRGPCLRRTADPA